MNHRGRTSESISLSSSCAAWPEACTGSDGMWKTSAPVRYRASTTRWIAGSLPGISDEERTTVSLGLELDPLVLARGHQRQRAVRLALRTGADHDDPAGIDARRPPRCRRRPGRRRAGCPRRRGRVDGLCIDRPRNAHDALVGRAAFTTCWIAVDVAREAGRDDQRRAPARRCRAARGRRCAR